MLCALIVATVFFAVSCARTPTVSRSKEIIKTHFKKYGKKYPETIYGKSKVAEVDITSTSEIHKHLVSVRAFITMKAGEVQRIYATLEKKASGWHLVSWENDTN